MWHPPARNEAEKAADRSEARVREKSFTEDQKRECRGCGRRRPSGQAVVRLGSPAASESAEGRLPPPEAGDRRSRGHGAHAGRRRHSGRRGRSAQSDHGVRDAPHQGFGPAPLHHLALTEQTFEAAAVIAVAAEALFRRAPCAPWVGRRCDRRETGTCIAARAVRRPSPAAAGEGPALGGPCVCNGAGVSRSQRGRHAQYRSRDATPAEDPVQERAALLIIYSRSCARRECG